MIFYARAPLRNDGPVPQSILSDTQTLWPAPPTLITSLGSQASIDSMTVLLECERVVAMTFPPSGGFVVSSHP